MLYAYCVRRAGEPGPPSGLTGIEGAPVRLLEEAGLGFWLSEGPSHPATAERLRDHDRVVRQALRSATPLPVRYGTGCFPSEPEAREALRSRAGEMTVALDRIADRVEMGVRVDWDPPERAPHGAPAGAGDAGPAATAGASPGRDATAPAGGGRAYLEARKREIRGRETARAAAAAVIDRLERELGLEEVPTVRTVLPAPGTAGIVAHLVRRSEVERYRACVAEAAGRLREYRISASGPWAPYSFT